MCGQRPSVVSSGLNRAVSDKLARNVFFALSVAQQLLKPQAAADEERELIGREIGNFL
jgi:hypothetical protein